MNDFSQLLNSSGGRKWLAMQYVLAELPESHRQEFESVMAEDVALCEAVVEACRLSAGVALAIESEGVTVLRGGDSSVMISREQPWATRFGVLAACVSLLAFMVLIARAPVSDSDREELASADGAAAVDVFVGFLQDQPPLGFEAEADMEMEMAPNESLSELMIPEWLLTAVDLEEQELSGDDEPPNVDSNLF